VGNPDAGPRSVRGGAIRVAGYVAGSAFAAGSSVLVLRYLSVAGFGHYATVLSLVAIVTGITDVGLTLVGQREYVLRTNHEEQRKLVANILGIRLLVTPVAVGLAALFAVAAGYESSLVVGTLIVGASLFLGNVTLTLTIPLTARLRFGATTATEVARQLVTVAGNALLVVVGAGLLAFFGVQVIAALAAVVLAAAFLGRRSLAWPRFAWREWRVILREAAPMGGAVIVAALYLRTLVVMASLLTSAFQTGLFATSYRVLEILVGVPALMVGSAFPIMAKAAREDEARLGAVLQQLLEMSMLAAVLLVIVLAIAAEPIVRILGGSTYTLAAPVLRIQSFALIGSFASVVWTTGLIAVRRQSALILINAFALISVALLGGALIPLFGADGAAVAAVAGEAVLALAALVMLLRAKPGLRPNLRFAIKLLPAAVLGTLCAFVPSVPTLAAAGIAIAVYSLTALGIGAVPKAATEAILAWRRPTRLAG
jgi:O-antigen/teichoic acid export membrane protein